MFAIFSRYNALFIRPHIRTAIREYQTTLIDRVKADIVELQEMYMDKNKMMRAIQVTDTLDIPDFSGKVMWLKLIESLLDKNMKRIADVLGEQWTNHMEGLAQSNYNFLCIKFKYYIGKELKRECDMLRQKLDTSQMYKEWSEKVLSKCKTSTDKLLCVEKQQRDGKIICRIRVNYSPDSIKISKEV
jgi:dynein heavy chain 1